MGLNFLELAEQVERLTGPSYDLNEQIGDAVGAAKRYQHPGSENEGYPNFLVSLDAAMSLVPEGMEVMAVSDDAVSLITRRPRTGGFNVHGESHTHARKHVPLSIRLATAITAACLRARARSTIAKEGVGG